MLLNIQALRAIAAILVVCYHALSHYNVMNGTNSIFIAISKWGFIGVDVFFVISGFVICQSTINKERNFENSLQFIKHRLLRIFLGYWPFYAASVLIIWHYSPWQLETLNLLGSFFLVDGEMNRLVVPVAWSLTLIHKSPALCIVTGKQEN